MDYLLSREKTSIESSNHLRARSILVHRKISTDDVLFPSKLRLRWTRYQFCTRTTFDLHYSVFNIRDVQPSKNEPRSQKKEPFARGLFYFVGDEGAFSLCSNHFLAFSMQAPAIARHERTSD